MRFLVDDEHKVVFGWSAKSGCSHVKKLFYFLTGNEDHAIHTLSDDCSLKWDENYFVYLFIRNPYDRLVSGFLDKYHEKGQYIYMWDHTVPLTFRNFVDELITGAYEHIDHHHFVPQLAEKWDDKIKDHKNLIIYDIASIDYKRLESIYDKKISRSILNYRGGHENKKELYDYSQHKYIHIYDLLQSQYDCNRPFVKNFFDLSILTKVMEFYKKDLEYFASMGFDYVP